MELHEAMRISSAGKARLVLLARQSVSYRQRQRARALAASGGAGVIIPALLLGPYKM